MNPALQPTPAANLTAVLIGRFQPFHHGHQALLERALREGERVVVVLGSAMQARSPKHPFTWEERAAMVRSAAGDRAHRLHFLPVRDYYDDARWVRAVVDGVHAVAGKGGPVALIGHDKDATSYYLNRFSAWQQVMEERRPGVDATPIRRVLFSGAPPQAVLEVLREQVPAPVHDYLRAWIELPFHKTLTDAWLNIRTQREKWASAPYPPVFVTVDAVVRGDDKVLLIRRGREPGAGLWALPGGFLDQDERLFQAAMRELREETSIGLLQVSLEDAFRSSKVFDHPQRSQRGRTITHAHFFDLGPHTPEVQAADDAADARWVPIAELCAMETELFEDHFAILDHFLELTPR
ncbi:MAG TPA: bifunctional nicotinamide-nucleotide adenylyltransferase/Nudix hydroxylase [Burkholderiaceae bacterium]|jgi:bifunctional NMN adenylyltransferase/nudix hydrolase|nr:bifunctional nicotinamide-nucleotide adenylyltransferase/Nudix hydroxylase [Burkholderiaceae bacterium]